eukprot:1161012-Pelagomonas_calceolata.AAC.5
MNLAQACVGRGLGKVREYCKDSAVTLPTCLIQALPKVCNGSLQLMWCSPAHPALACAAPTPPVAGKQQEMHILHRMAGEALQLLESGALNP